jgi:hypothetical protein
VSGPTIPDARDALTSDDADKAALLSYRKPSSQIWGITSPLQQLVPVGDAFNAGMGALGRVLINHGSAF